MNYNEITGKKLPETIDLNASHCEEYLKAKKRMLFDLNKTFVLILIGIFALLYIFTIFVNYVKAQDPFELQHNNWFTEEKRNQEYDRKQRLIACKQELSKNGLGITEIFGQDLVVRCATYATLVFSFESNFGNSEICKNQKNCFGIRQNGDFETYKSYQKGNERFAYFWYRSYYKYDINTFVNWWSLTDRENYKFFMKSNYRKIYGEIEKLYFK